MTKKIKLHTKKSKQIFFLQIICLLFYGQTALCNYDPPLSELVIESSDTEEEDSISSNEKSSEQDTSPDTSQTVDSETTSSSDKQHEDDSSSEIQENSTEKNTSLEKNVVEKLIDPTVTVLDGSLLIKTFKLIAIGYNLKSSYCIINNLLLSEGEKIEGFEIQKISPDRVILWDVNKTEHVLFLNTN